MPHPPITVMVVDQALMAHALGRLLSDSPELAVRATTVSSAARVMAESHREPEVIVVSDPDLRRDVASRGRTADSSGTEQQRRPLDDLRARPPRGRGLRGGLRGGGVEIRTPRCTGRRDRAGAR